MFILSGNYGIVCAIIIYDGGDVMDIMRDDYFDEFLFLDNNKPIAKDGEPDPLNPGEPKGGSSTVIADITTFEAIAQEADKKNANNRIYPKAVLEAALAKLQPKIKQKKVVVFSDHPNWMDGPRNSRIAGRITEAFLNDKNKVVIRGKFAKNAAAAEVITLYKDLDMRPGMSARGYGAYDTDSKTGTMTFKLDYEIEGWDFVVFPAANAHATKFESMETKTESKEDKKMDEIKTVEGLNKAYPELVALVEKPLSEKIAVADTKLAAVNASKVELQTKFDELNGRFITTTKALDEINGRLTLAVEENVKNKRDIAKAELKLAVDAFMKDQKYAKHIVIDESLRTLDEVKTFVEKKTAELDAFAATLVTPPDTVIKETPKAKGEDIKIDKKSTDPLIDLYIKMATN